MERVILHCDCNCFFASVEAALDPSLNKYAFAVCGDPEMRHGIILAKNEAAKKFGVKTGEAIWQAKAKCPRLVLVAPHYSCYKDFSSRIFSVYSQYTELVEPFGIDEAWLDVTGSVKLFGSGFEIAEKLRERIKNEIGVSISVGVSFNKTFAKMGSDYKKPDATTVITKENFRELLYPLPAGDFFMVGRSTAKKLFNVGIKTVGDIAEADEDFICRLLGENGEKLLQTIYGYDYSPVKPFGFREPYKSIGNGLTFKRDLVNPSEVRTCVFYLCDKVAARLRKHNKECTAVQVGIKDTALHVTERSMQLSLPTDLSFDLKGNVLSLIEENHDVSVSPIRAITVTGIRLLESDDVCEQISLFDIDYYRKREKEQRLELTRDSIRRKYGLEKLRRCSIIENEFGI